MKRFLRSIISKQGVVLAVFLAIYLVFGFMIVSDYFNNRLYHRMTYDDHMFDFRNAIVFLLCAFIHLSIGIAGVLAPYLRKTAARKFAVVNILVGAIFTFIWSVNSLISYTNALNV